MHSIFRLLICLPLVFCSCSVQTYRYFADKAREGESVYIPRDTEHPKSVLFYRVGDKTYVRGIRCRTIATSSRYIHNHLPFSDVSIWEQHIPVSEAEQTTVYCEVKSQRLPNGDRSWQKTDSPWIDSLPNNARPFLSSDVLLGFYHGKLFMGVEAVETRPMRTTGKALLYYPLAAGTFVAVDVPLTLAVNAVMACGWAVYLTAAGCESLFYGVCSMGECCIDAFTSEETSPSPSSGE